MKLDPAARLIAEALIFALLLLFFSSTGYAHDPEHPEHEGWYNGLKQPDNPAGSCCGIADAYWADKLAVRKGKTYATVTDTRDDRPLKRHHVPFGTEIEVPKEKLKWDEGNPTGHAVIFLDVNDNAICFVQGTGT